MTMKGHHERNRNHERDKGYADDRSRGCHRRNEHDNDTYLDSKFGDDLRTCSQGRNLDDWILKSVKLEPPSFDGRMDPKVYSD